MKNMMKKYGKNWICWLIWIGIWQLADLFIHNNVIFAGPVNMAVTLAGLLKDGDFWLILLHSAFRICSGFLSVLEAADAKSVGGQLPADDFYYLP